MSAEAASEDEGRQAPATALSTRAGDASAGRPEVASRPLHIALVFGSNLTYNQTIYQAFATTLERGLDVSPDFSVKGGVQALWHDADQTDELERRVRTLLEAGPFDYHVGVGTQACRAWRNVLGADFGLIAPMIFIGVTYPVEIGLVNGLNNRNDVRCVAGVSYVDGGLSGIANYINHRMLTRDFYERNPHITPKPKFHFVYRSDVSQDRMAADMLRLTDLSRREEIAFVETVLTPSAEDLDDSIGPYCSWFTLEAMFEESAEALEFLKTRFVVSSSRLIVKNGWAAVGVSADDREIGRCGAELILRHQRGELALEACPVHTPRPMHWVHLEAAKRLGVTFPEEFLKAAADVF